MKGTGIGVTAAAIMAYDGPRSIARAWSMALPQDQRPLLLHNNENPLGPGDKVIWSLNQALEGGRAGRYPGGVNVGGAIADVVGNRTSPTDIAHSGVGFAVGYIHGPLSPTLPHSG